MEIKCYLLNFHYLLALQLWMKDYYLNQKHNINPLFQLFKTAKYYQEMSPKIILGKRIFSVFT